MTPTPWLLLVGGCLPAAADPHPAAGTHQGVGRAGGPSGFSRLVDCQQAQGMSGMPQYTGALDCLRQTVAAGGVRALYSGIGPNFSKAAPPAGHLNSCGGRRITPAAVSRRSLQWRSRTPPTRRRGRRWSRARENEPADSAGASRSARARTGGMSRPSSAFSGGVAGRSCPIVRVEGAQRPNLKSEDSGFRHRFSEAKVSLWMCENGTGHEEARGPTRR